MNQQGRAGPVVAGLRRAHSSQIHPVDRSLEAPEEFILPSQTVEDIINKFDDIAVGYCFCRQRRSLLGDACDTSAPTLNCFTFGKSARHTAAQGFAKKVSKGAAPGICFAASIAAGLKTERSRLWI